MDETSATLAACGSSPQAHSMAGFSCLDPDCLVTSSESLLGVEGLDVPGLEREREGERERKRERERDREREVIYSALSVPDGV